METQAMFPYLIEITTPETDDIPSQIFRYANTDTDIVFENNTYEASYFKLTPPEVSDTAVKDATITISAVDETWIEKIRTYQDRSRIRFVAIIKYDESGHQYQEPINDIDMVLTNASWNDTTIQWTMKFDDWMEINMPVGKFNEFTCPALY